jgi:hypothetical protein
MLLRLRGVGRVVGALGLGLVVGAGGACATPSSTTASDRALAGVGAGALQRPQDFDARPPSSLASSSLASSARPSASSGASASVSVSASVSASAGDGGGVGSHDEGQAAPRPRTAAEAGVLVGEAMACLQRGEKACALPRIAALLRSDFLSERGRANLYWLLAEAADGVDDGRRRDALGGYLVAASVLPEDAELRDRMARARAWLVASDVRTLKLGTTPEQAIDVGSAREADVVVAALHCGQRGGRYVERSARSDRGRGASLAARRLLCTETGDELTLWFRLPR